MKNVRVSKVGSYIIYVTYVKKINHQNNSYKVDSGVECGKDRLTGTTRHSRKVVKNMSSKIASFLYFVYGFLVQFIFYVVPIL
jgi:hypothetical protein